MRIIGGKDRGRKLSTPKSGRNGLSIRPTSDRAREAIFNIIGERVSSANVLDLFAGTGALGLEALSRGAAMALFVDSQATAINLIESNIQKCGLSERSTVLRRDLKKGLSFLQHYRPANGFSLVFLDPPYGNNLSSEVLLKLDDCDCLADNTLVIVEEITGTVLPDSTERFILSDQRRYGDTGFWLYSNKENRPHGRL